ncbi:NAD(P)-dependent oxidoreductase [Candidatus Sumerlaeota bacterium]|nr:NAD(P)-dependent oxidoreductase [Candidatus Sumerlaeota bacterium]
MNLWDMETIQTEESLDDFLATPYPETIEMMRRIKGDIVILGAGGKMGVSLARVALNACKLTGIRKKIIGVDVSIPDKLVSLGVEVIECDLLDPDKVNLLPLADNVIFMAGRKFGVKGSEELTWMINAIVPYNVGNRYVNSRIVAFSTGCVYPLVSFESGGCRETDPPDPVGEYANSCLARERVFEYFSRHRLTPLLLFRLNYSIDLRYGVLLDIAQNVFDEKPVDLSVGYVNCIWQGDAINRALLCLEHAACPPAILNVTGDWMLPVKDLAEKFAEIFAKKVGFCGKDSGKAYLSNTARSVELFGKPRVSVDNMIQWVADWIKMGGATLDKPTHFQVTDGQFLDEDHKS